MYTNLPSYVGCCAGSRGVAADHRELVSHALQLHLLEGIRSANRPVPVRAGSTVSGVTVNAKYRMC